MRGAIAVLALLGVAVSAAAAPEEPSTCISCHVDEDEDLSAPVEEWRRSTHAQVDVSCDACHGGDPLAEDEEASMSEDDAGFVGAPGWREVPELCGACHEDVLQGYRESVMAGMIGDGERVAVCTTCHMTDGHAIVPVTPRQVLTEERCGECHDPQRALDLLDALESTQTHFEAVESDLAGLRGRIDTGLVDREMRELRSRYVVIAHTYDRERIVEVAQVSSARLDAVADEADALGAELDFRRRLGVAVVAFFALACAGAIQLERDLRRRIR